MVACGELGDLHPDSSGTVKTLNYESIKLRSASAITLSMCFLSGYTTPCGFDLKADCRYALRRLARLKLVMGEPGEGK
jgi:hypothetical protein